VGILVMIQRRASGLRTTLQTLIPEQIYPIG